jgi:hypothetical protein
LHYYQQLVADARRAICEHRYAAWAAEVRARFSAPSADMDPRDESVS